MQTIMVPLFRAKKIKSKQQFHKVPRFRIYTLLQTGIILNPIKLVVLKLKSGSKINSSEKVWKLFA
jgi:hypothetical protein